jgi:hypothetical protein
MSRPFEHGGLVACGVLLGALELLSIAAVARWPAVDDPEPRWTRVVPDAPAAEPSAPAREAAIDETEASVLLGRQVLDRVGHWIGTGTFRAASARLEQARQPWRRIRPAFGRPCRPDGRAGCD